MATRFPGEPLIGRGDVIEELSFFLEQLEQTVALILSGRPASQRIALVALDSLAEVLLYAHAHSHFRASEELRWFRQQAYPAGRRRAILGDFNRKVTLGQKQVEGSMAFGYPDPLLDGFDATVFRVAHRYRNATYHRGQNNTALVGPLTRLYAGAVGRSFGRSLRPGWAIGGLAPARLQALEHLGWRPGETAGWLEPRATAEEIITRLCEPLTVQKSLLAGQLKEDLEDRCSAVEECLQTLRTDGLNDAHLEEMLRGSQLQAAHSDDEELVRLQDEQVALLNAAQAADDLTEAAREALRANEQAQFLRIAEIDAVFKQQVDLRTPEAVRRGARRLAHARTLAALLERYQGLDERLQLVEAAVEWMTVEWDRYVQMEIDRVRGK